MKEGRRNAIDGEVIIELVLIDGAKMHLTLYGVFWGLPNNTLETGGVADGRRAHQAVHKAVFGNNGVFLVGAHHDIVIVACNQRVGAEERQRLLGIGQAQSHSAVG